MSNMRLRAFTFVVAVIGTVLFSLLGLPLPFLFGPMSVCLVAALWGARLTGFGQLTAGARTILGVAVGTSITPDVVAELPSMAGSLVLVPIYIAVIGCVGVPFFRSVCKFDGATAYYAAMPGGLQDMILFGQEAGADTRVLSLLHATRVLVIVTLAPILLISFYDVSFSNPIGEPAAEIALKELVLMAGAAWLGWKGGERIGLFGASILGPLIVSAVLTLSGFIHSRPPAEAILAAQFFIGVVIGVYYVGVTLGELKSVVLSGLAFMGVLAVLAACFAELVTVLGLAPSMEAFLAFAPGGQAEMTILAIVTGADLGFVIAHHLTRIVVVIVGAPLAARVLRKIFGD
ncbi:AbrB family transcriptional regulator [Shimia sp. MMG029]|uniref:AbrB family transcriptional regulator n=1 Tax=Shimia sp. MMG029 TaxID=3021978 RepID=UPI0022FE1037|nr:AbrB family transcriptional regulator [Shimia sp. MMG029]MDA5555152.1 AbrB family transcriptional regulator [Shimia sp. MMG029]